MKPFAIIYACYRCMRMVTLAWEVQQEACPPRASPSLLPTDSWLHSGPTSHVAPPQVMCTGERQRTRHFCQWQSMKSRWLTGEQCHYHLFSLSRGTRSATHQVDLIRSVVMVLRRCPIPSNLALWSLPLTEEEWLTPLGYKVKGAMISNRTFYITTTDSTWCF